MESDPAYFRRRASEAYLCVANADLPAAREAHLAMAKRYEDLARSLVEGDAASGSLSDTERSAEIEDEAI
jgi:hypothetical protein